MSSMLTKQIVQEGVSKVIEVVITCEENGVEISSLMGDVIEKGNVSVISPCGDLFQYPLKRLVFLPCTDPAGSFLE